MSGSANIKNNGSLAGVSANSVKQTPIVTLLQGVTSLQRFTGNLISSIGVDSSGQYIKNISTPFISSAVSFSNADVLLANAILNTKTTLVNTINDNKTSFTNDIDVEKRRAIAAEQTLSVGILSTVSYIDTRLTNLIDNAPDILNTLNELATALGDDPRAFLNLTSSINGLKEKTTEAESKLRSFITVNGQQAFDNKNRTKYAGPHSPNNFMNFYSTSTYSNPFENPALYGTKTILTPDTENNIIELPSYNRYWKFVGTFDLTYANALNPYEITENDNANYTYFKDSYIDKIPYYDVYINPYKVYGPSYDYGFIRDGSDNPVQINSAWILVRDQTDLYSTLKGENPETVFNLKEEMTDNSGEWFIIRKDILPEIERTIHIANGNNYNSENLFVNGRSTVFEMAPGDSYDFIFTDTGWIFLQ